MDEIQLILNKLTNLFGYEIPRCESPDLYFQLMALQVGTLANPEAEDQLRSLEKIRVLCKICELFVRRKIKVQKEFLKTFNKDDNNDTDQPRRT